MPALSAVITRPAPRRRRKDGGAVERSGLENRQVMSLVGSNPTPSATWRGRIEAECVRLENGSVMSTVGSNPTLSANIVNHIWSHRQGFRALDVLSGDWQRELRDSARLRPIAGLVSAVKPGSVRRRPQGRTLPTEERS